MLFKMSRKRIFFENKENPEPTLAPAINIYKYVSLYVSYIDIQHLDDISL